jgi:hypothetical protein
VVEIGRQREEYHGAGWDGGPALLDGLDVNAAGQLGWAVVAQPLLDRLRSWARGTKCRLTTNTEPSFRSHFRQPNHRDFISSRQSLSPSRGS